MVVLLATTNNNTIDGFNSFNSCQNKNSVRKMVTVIPYSYGSTDVLAIRLRIRPIVASSEKQVVSRT